MLDLKSVILTILTSAWGVVTVALIAMVVYRGVLGLSRRRLDLSRRRRNSTTAWSSRRSSATNPRSWKRANHRPSPVAAGVLFLSTVGAWIYQGYTSF